ncbi:MAG: cupin, partial [Moorea sp. SIO2I5]|nr:cupin [Moorena sp. SIO2I5]
YLKCTLTPGDVLYIPRGHWHYAVALDQPSLHLTLGIHCQTGVDFLDWLVSELRENEAWRESLPLRFDAEPLDQSIDNLIQNLKQYLTNSDIQERYNRYLDGLVKPLARYSLPAQAGFNIFPNGVETRFSNPKFKRLKISQLPDHNGYKIIVSGKEIILGGVTESLVENLFTRETFTGSDVMTWLPGFDWEVDVVPLLTHLVTEGIIFVDTRV